MVGNYITIGMRQLRKQNVYSIVSLFGITLSITCSILLFLYLRNEFTFDQYDSEIPVYRIASKAIISGISIESPTTPSALGPELPYTYVRIRTQAEAVVQLQSNLFHEDRIYAVDNSFFDIFPLELLEVREGPLLSTNTIVLTKSLSKKYFGDDFGVGKVIVFNGKKKIVSGIVKDPFKSHLNFTGLVLNIEDHKFWTNFTDYTYLKTTASLDEIEAKLKSTYEEKMEPFFVPNNSSCAFYLQPVESIHLESSLRGELDVNGNRTINFALLLIGIFMLLVAGINYTNMATTRTLKRAKEIAIRKAVGSYRAELVWQFLIESILLVFFGVFLSLIAIDLIFPYLHFVTYTDLYDISILDWQLMIFILLVVLAIGLMGSIFPAFQMARFNVSEILNGTYQPPEDRITKRRLLLFIQFSISILLVICTWVIKKQINYVNQVNLGYNPELLMTLVLPSEVERDTWMFLEKVSNIDEVQSVSTTEVIPGEAPESLTSFYFESDVEQQILLKYFHADNAFLENMQIKIIEEMPAIENYKNAILINQKLASRINAEKVLGLKVRVPIQTLGSGVKTIRGVFNDVHLQSLHDEIQPLAILYQPINRYAIIRLKEDSENNISAVKEIFQASFPDFPFDFQFVDERVESMYRRDVLTGRLFGIFALITTSLALMGMFALSYYTSEIRKQEISIRKINGASVGEILFLINKEYFILVGLAGLVAIPIAYLFLEVWLEDFIYKINLDAFLFVMALVISLVVAMATVSINTLKAARSEIIASIKR